MIKIPNVFSDRALFLHSSVLELRGIADADVNVNAKISQDGSVFSESSAISAQDGSFSVCVKTPPASFLEYTVTITAGNDTYSFDKVLFGELWIAAGQSNMAMSNSQQPDWEREYRRLLSLNKLRAYAPRKLGADSMEYPSEPQSFHDGEWIDPDNKSAYTYVSALATAFSIELFDLFKRRGESVPIGFINANYGGTPISAWIPDDVLAKDESIAYKRSDRTSWNNTDTPNFQQSSAQYNYVVHPLIGVKARGMLWYQGENDTVKEQTLHVYQKLLTTLYDTYKELFAPPGSSFPCICSQIYPWAYEYEKSECDAGYMNRNFTELARKYPDDFSFVPVCDLPPIWTYHLDNGPIHPAHKYELGRRFAKLTWNFCYETRFANMQKHPATLSSYSKKGNVLHLEFNDVGEGLYYSGKRVRGIYIRSERSVYVPAFCEIVSKNEMNVWHPYIDEPIHVAYAVSSGETETNLFAGEFPVAPFCTEFTEENGYVEIGIKTWLFNDVISDFIYQQPMTKERKRAFSIPVFRPLCDSEICYDSVFSRSGRSLAVFGDGEYFGAYIKKGQYRPLDLYNYSSLKMSVYNSRELFSFITVYYTEENSIKTVRIEGVVEEELDFGWERVAFDLSKLPKGDITQVEFAFKSKENRTPAANIDELILVPRV